MDKEFEIVLSETDKIFATGVFLRPFEIEVNGIKQWRWISDGFIDENYYAGNDGLSYIVDVYDYADNPQGLLIESVENDTFNSL